ncbi:hypothetical protein BAE44_0020801 [Dichanthelium oligosanthes]|uniref:Uncharacterized protein n=1 Tax=Dichanthelium oligosanthes TaxID=888268 RepID=A0A1E5UZ81_9POAL|nr:hypothetical protein BAE44_0020801 [Dichanthelium oligosanthes]
MHQALSPLEKLNGLFFLHRAARRHWASLWSSLPSDLVNRVADCLLAYNDLDYYMGLRAVCPTGAPPPPIGLAAPTATPPCSTSKFDFVTTTAGGLLVLAEKRESAAPRAARLLNPFTGSMIRFAAPIPPELKAASAVLGSSSSTTLLLFCESSHTVFYTDTVQESFAVYPETFSRCPLFKVAIRSGVCAAARGGINGDAVTLSAVLGLVSYLPAMKDVTHQCFMVESASSVEILIVVVRRQGVVEIMRMDPVRSVLEPAGDQPRRPYVRSSSA